MTPTTFARWLDDMRAANIAPTDKACAAALGVTPNGLLRMKRHGATRQTALACAALLAGMCRYGSNEEAPQGDE